MIPFYMVSPENKMGMSKPGILCKLLIIPSLILWSYTSTLFSYSYQLLSFLSSSKFNSIIFLLLSHSAMSNSLDPMDCSMPGFPVLHYLPEFAQTHIPWVSDAIQPSRPLPPPSSFALNFSQHQGPSDESALRIRWPDDRRSKPMKHLEKSTREHLQNLGVTKDFFKQDIKKITSQKRKNSDKVNYIKIKNFCS